MTLFPLGVQAVRSLLWPTGRSSSADAQCGPYSDSHSPNCFDRRTTQCHADHYPDPDVIEVPVTEAARRHRLIPPRP